MLVSLSAFHSTMSQVYLVLCGDRSDQLLQRTCAVLIKSDLGHRVCGIVDQDCKLLRVTFLEQFLAQVVAERV